MKAKYLEVAARHIEAAKTGNYDLLEVKTMGELEQAMRDGKTVRSVLDEIEIRFTSITSIMLSKVLFHESKNYVRGVRKGFKLLFIKLNIQ